MKYIKLYESFDSDIEDILLEITDIGYKYLINRAGVVSNCVIMYNKSSTCDFDDIKEYVLRLKDYLGARYLGCRIYCGGLSDWVDMPFNLVEDCDDIEGLISIMIDFKRI